MEKKSYTSIAKLFANVPMRRGAANGSSHVAKMINLNIHPDNANQRKKIVYRQENVSGHKELKVRYKQN